MKPGGRVNLASLNAATPILWVAGALGIALGGAGLVYYAAAFLRLLWLRRVGMSRR